MASTLIRTILAGDETGTPPDSPIGRLDFDNLFPFVGALSMRLGARTSVGSAVALSPEWVLTAGHNTDFNDDGVADPGMVTTFHLSGHGIFAVTEFHVHPDFTGFASPALNDDLALLRLGSPITGSLSYPSVGSILGNGEEVALVGFGRSGFGDLGYTSASSLASRRFGSNVIDQLSPDDEGGGFSEVYRYDFDNPDSVGQADGSLGNAVETIIGPGDSGGPALRQSADGWEVVGINTFTQGRGGRFGDTGGGIVLAPYEDWINTTTGIPEPGVGIVLALGAFAALVRRRRGGE
jgi:uncharacterized protein (TIGR03382 family)